MRGTHESWPQVSAFNLPPLNLTFLTDSVGLSCLLYLAKNENGISPSSANILTKNKIVLQAGPSGRIVGLS